MLEKKGLREEEIVELRKKYGANELVNEKKESFFFKIVHIICEPMFLLLIIAATIYFILGEPKDGIIMLIFVIGIIMIDIIEEWKTDKTLNALKDLSEPKIIVLREGKKKEIHSKNLVPGDIMYIHEGVKIPADGYVIKCSGLRVDESSLTGESISSLEEKYKGKNYGEFKKSVADIVCAELEKIQSKVKEIQSGNTIEKILEDGAMKASYVARKKLSKVYRKMGIN